MKRTVFSTPCYEFKSLVLNLDSITNILKLRAQCDYAEYLEYEHKPEILSPLPFSTSLQIRTFFQCRYRNEWEEAGKINHAKFQRTKRLRAKMEYLVTHYDCAFLTLTFNDDFLNRTTAATRRQKVSRFLNSLECPYIANIDFGSKNGREHYHAVVACIPSDDQMAFYSSGFYSVLPVCTTENDVVRIAKYVAKLTNHAIKETTKRSVLLYSRKYKIPV